MVSEVSMHNNVKSERVRIGKTVEEVADAVGVTASAVIKWESHDTEPSGKNIVRLANYFGCTADYLLDMVDDRHATAG